MADGGRRGRDDGEAEDRGEGVWESRCRAKNPFPLRLTLTTDRAEHGRLAERDFAPYGTMVSGSAVLPRPEWDRPAC